MRGHEGIIAMRKQGMAPKMVFINDFPCKTDWFENNDHATVRIDGDSVGSIDLRFLVGLAVSVSASTENRAKSLLDACKRHGAKTVAVCHKIQVNKYRIESGYTEVFHG